MPAKKKIPLPWAYEVDETRQIQTLDYWMISQSWNGRCSKPITVQEALRLSNVILEEIDPQKRLAFHVNELKNNIVCHGTKARQIKWEKIQDEVANPQGLVAKVILL